ncbi:MAG: retropepsin-like aspartic protease [Saprospiraceae bacterium]
MKILIPFICMLIFGGTILSQNYQPTYTVQMKRGANGVYLIPCALNGLKMDFIFDTGASLVSISASEAEFMAKHEYIKESDMIETTELQVADGTKVNAIIVNLRRVDIGPSFSLFDVKAVIMPNQSAPLLLGQSVLSKLGDWSIDNSNATFIFKPDDFSKEEDEEIDKSFSDGTIVYKLGINIMEAIESGNEQEFANKIGFKLIKKDINTHSFLFARDNISFMCASYYNEGWTNKIATISTSYQSCGSLIYVYNKLITEQLVIKIGENTKSPTIKSASVFLKPGMSCTQYMLNFVSSDTKVVYEICSDGEKTTYTIAKMTR